jgi:hypothetical protein
MQYSILNIAPHGGIAVITVPKPQFVTMDAIANVYYPLVMAKPVLIIYFLPLLMCLACTLQHIATDETICCGQGPKVGPFMGALRFLSIGLMNLVTAVLAQPSVRNSLLVAKHGHTRIAMNRPGYHASLLRSYIPSRDPCGTFYLPLHSKSIYGFLILHAQAPPPTYIHFVKNVIPNSERGDWWRARRSKVEHALEHASQEAEHARLNQKQRSPA